MKKLLLVIVIVLAFVSIHYAATFVYEPVDLGIANIAISSATVTAIMNSTATVIGRERWCYNCTANGGAGTMCYSTGTTNAFSYVLSTGTPCK